MIPRAKSWLRENAPENSSSVYSPPAPVSDADLAVMQRVDALHLEHPYAGAPMPRDGLGREGVKVGRTHVSTLLRRMRIAAV